MAKPAYHHGDLQAQSLALDILRTQGDAAISLRALAKQIGVSAPALYRHFSDRETLLAEPMLTEGVLSLLLDGTRSGSPQQAEQSSQQ